MVQELELDKMEEKSKISLRHKSLLVSLKYIPHSISLLYVIYTIFQFLNIDLIVIGYITVFLLMMFMLGCSIVFRYCYVHRLPIYYILFNDLTSTYDYYIGLPVTDKILLGIHLTAIGCLILGYTKYYLKCRLTV